MRKYCLYCGSPIWEERRGRRKYCGDTCRVYFNRDKQNSVESLSKRRQNEEHYDRAIVALEMYTNTPLEKREEWLQSYIDNPTTKNILTNPILLESSKKTITQIADDYTQRTYGVKIYDYYP